MRQNQIITLILIIIFSGASFIGGVVYQKSKSVVLNRTNQDYQNRNGVRGVGQAAGMMNGRRGGQLIGEIISKDDKSITLKTTDGDNKIILLSSSTSINKTSDGSVGDLKVGSKIGIFGSNNTDGSVSAQNIQLNPISPVFTSPTVSPIK